ncbi:MAG: hypothetical protein JST21_17290 [Bacteroidetes bacterium]|nr:hypothetical protein [Bacteroidota bacterium]
MNNKTTLLLLVLSILNLISQAQTPARFNFQGVAKNNDGTAVANQSIKLRFTLHDSAATGTVLYKETRNATTDDNGLFSVVIGGGGASNVTGSLTNINWAVNNKFLKTELQIVGNGGFKNLGTTQLESVPYSEQSRKSDTAKFASYTSNLKTFLTDASSFTQDNIPGGTTAVISFVSNILSDTNFNSSTHEYTIPSSGNYMIAFNVNLFQLSNGGKANGTLAIRINGSNTLYTQQFKYPVNTESTGNYYPLTGTYIKYFTTGQKVTIAVSNNGSNSDPLNTFNALGVELNILKIGTR